MADNTDNKDNDRDRRLADASRLLDACRPYGKVENKARIAAIHNELMYAIDRAINKNVGHRFKQAELDIIKDVAFHIIYVLDGMHSSRGGFVRDAWREFKSHSPIKKITNVAGASAFIAAALIGAITIYKDTIHPLIFQSPPTLAAPKSPTPNPGPKSAPTPGWMDTVTPPKGPGK